MRMSRERIHHLADAILRDLNTLDGVRMKSMDDVRMELVRSLSDEAKLEDTIDVEVRRILGSYARPVPEGSREWDVAYQKTREEVLRRRFRQ
jgi:hypothetical protein